LDERVADIDAILVEVVALEEISSSERRARTSSERAWGRERERGRAQVLKAF